MVQREGRGGGVLTLLQCTLPELPLRHMYTYPGATFLTMMRLGEIVTVAVSVRVWGLVAVAEDVELDVLVAVRVYVGVSVGVGVELRVDVAVRVCVAVRVRVAVKVRVEVAVGDGVGVFV